MAVLEKQVFERVNKDGNFVLQDEKKKDHLPCYKSVNGEWFAAEKTKEQVGTEERELVDPSGKKYIETVPVYRNIYDIKSSNAVLGGPNEPAGWEKKSMESKNAMTVGISFCPVCKVVFKDETGLLEHLPSHYVKVEEKTTQEVKKAGRPKKETNEKVEQQVV